MKCHVSFAASEPLRRQYLHAVAIHGHTQYSEEPLDCLQNRKALGYLLRRALHIEGEGKGNPTLGDRKTLLWWTPPVSVQQAVELEAAQIQQLSFGGWEPMVSLTDHDNTLAATAVPTTTIGKTVVSMEWTVPLGPSFIHLGIHNLPAADHPLVSAMQRYTSQIPLRTNLRSLLEWINAYRDVLIVLNHPAWDEGGIGKNLHHAMVQEFLAGNREFVHAIELNGLRAWRENAVICDLALRHGKPVIAGGDRHGRQASAVLNLTNASTFSEFVHEVRDGRSYVLFTPRYRQSQRARISEIVFDVLRDYPDDAVGRRLWSDRIFAEDASGIARSWTEIWQERPPALTRALLRIVGAAQRDPWVDRLHSILTGNERLPAQV